MEEIRISPVVARKGYLNILEQKANGWKKRWVVRTAVKDCFPLP
jgi:kinesin family protein 1